MNDWNIGLAAWIIQDGNYSDFSRNQGREFAVEFYPHTVRPSLTKAKSAILVADSTYRLTAEVIFRTTGVWVIDFGISAYQQSEPPITIEKGEWVEGTFYLGVDPFFYFEELSDLKGMPPLIHQWHIKQIHVETAPFVETIDDRGAKMLVRDQSKSSFREVEQTDAWKDDGGNAEYILKCQPTDQAPAHHRQQQL